MWATRDKIDHYKQLAKSWRRNLPPVWHEPDDKELAWFGEISYMAYDFSLRLECVRSDGSIDLPKDGYCSSPTGYIRWCVLEPALRILGWCEGGVSWVTVLESQIDNHVIYEQLPPPPAPPRLASSFAMAAEAARDAVAQLLGSFEAPDDPARGGAALSQTVAAFAQLVALAEVEQWKNLSMEVGRDPAA